MTDSPVEPKTSTGRRVGLGVVVLAALVGLVVVADVQLDAILGQLSAADPRYLALALVASLVAQLAWAAVSWLFLRTLDEDVSSERVGFGYLAGTFAKQVLPFGHAGGVPLLAYVFSSDLKLDYRQTFAAVTASELVIFCSSLVVAAVGFGWYLLTTPVGSGLGGVVAVGTAGLVVGLVGVARYGRGTLSRTARLLAAVGRVTLGRLVPSVRPRLAADAVDRGVAGFFETFDRATADRSVVARAAVIALVGWVLFTLPLYFGFLAVGYSMPLALSLLLVPAGGLATLLPTPGGLGGTEVGTAAVLVVLTGATVDVVAAAVLLYRLASYWFVVAVGGASSLYLSVGLTDLRPSGK